MQFQSMSARQHRISDRFSQHVSLIRPVSISVSQFSKNQTVYQPLAQNSSPIIIATSLYLSAYKFIRTHTALIVNKFKQGIQSVSSRQMLAQCMWYTFSLSVINHEIVSKVSSSALVRLQDMPVQFSRKQFMSVSYSGPFQQIWKYSLWSQFPLFW